MIYILAGQSSLAHLNTERFLHLNRNVFAQNKIIYPLNGYRGWNHQNIFWELTNSDKFENEYGTLKGLCEAIITQKEKDDKTDFIISLPSLFISYQGLLKRAMTQLKQHDQITFIVMLNHQLNYLYPFWYHERSQLDFAKWIKWRLACSAFGANYFKNYKKLISMDGIDQIKFLHTDHLISKNVLNETVCDLVGLSKSTNETLLFKDKSTVSVFPKPRFENDLIEFAEEFYADSNEELAKQYESLSQLNNRDYLK